MPWVLDTPGQASPDLLKRVEWRESRGNPNAVSPKGAQGAMQLMPDTMADPGFGVKPFDRSAPDPVAENRRMGRDYLNAMLDRYEGDEEAALVAYNWGPGNADKWVSAGRDRAKLPRETQGYLGEILDRRPTAADINMSGPKLGAVGAPKQGRWVLAEDADKPAPELQKAATGQPGPSVAGDVVKSFGTGVQKGLTGLVGLPGDVRQAAASGIEAATGLELPEMPSWLPAHIAGLPTGARTTEELQGGLERAGLPVHQPETMAGEYAQTLGEFIPAVAGGAGGVVRKVAQAAVPAVASETAGQVARQVAPDYEAAARVATGIAASPAGARAGFKKPPTFKPETAAKLRAEAKLAFMEAEQQGIKIDGKRVQSMVADLERRLATEGFDADLHPKASSALRRLKSEADEFRQKPAPAMSAMTGAKPPQAKQGLPLTEAQTVRRILSTAARSPDKDERRLASMMIASLDDLVDSFGGQKMAKARALYHKFSKAQQIEDMLENSGLRSGQFSVSGMENAVRTEFRQLYRKIIKDGRERGRWTPEQRKLIKKLGNMRGAVNILRTIGKLSPRSQLMLAGGLTGGGISYGSGDPTAAAVAGAGWGIGSAAQLAALGLTKRKVNQLRANVTGSAPPPTVPGSLGVARNPLAAALLGQSSTLPVREFVGQGAN